MTARELAHERIDQLDDDQLARLLSFIDELADESVDTSERPRRSTLQALVGIGRSAEPTNIAEHKDDYLAEAFDIDRR